MTGVQTSGLTAYTEDMAADAFAVTSPGQQELVGGVVRDTTVFPPGATESWKAINPGIAITVMGDEFIQVREGVPYSFTCQMREMNATAVGDANDSFMYLGFACFDRDKKSIAPYMVNEVPGTRTKLIRDLNPGDTTIEVYSLVGWTPVQTNPSDYHRNSIIFWNYASANGQKYAPGVYSRNVLVNPGGLPAYRQLFGLTITLNQPYVGPVIPAGTYVSNTFSGGSYAYSVSQHKLGAAWESFTANISGRAPVGTAPGNKLWGGTEYIKPLILMNRNRLATNHDAATKSNADQRVALPKVTYPDARCFDNNSYRGGALTIFGYDLVGTSVKVYRTDEHGRYRTMVWGSNGLPIVNGRVVITDPEVPFHQNLIYEIHQEPGGEVVKTSGCILKPSSIYPDDKYLCVPVYLSDPLYPSNGDWFALLSIDPLTYPARTSLHDVLGRHAPVAVSQVRGTAKTTIRLMTTTLEDRQRMLTILMPGRILQFRHTSPLYPEDNLYISVGDVSEERISSDHADPHRRWVLDVTVVDRPVGKLVAAVRGNRTYETLRDFEPDGVNPINPPSYGTSTEIIGAYADYVDYVHVFIGGGSASSKYGLGAELQRSLYGDAQAKLPTIEAARLNWSLR